MVDYAIAQKIVELHVRQKESVSRMYSQVRRLQQCAGPTAGSLGVFRGGVDLNRFRVRVLFFLCQCAGRAFWRIPLLFGGTVKPL